MVAPTITSIAPSSGGSGTLALIVGTDFTGTTGVTINGVAVTRFGEADDSNVLVVIPAGTGTGDVVLTTSGGSDTLTDGWSYHIGTLATATEVLLAIGADASAVQISTTNINIWILMAESDMEAVAGEKVGLVSNYSSITAAHKQWLALVASHRAAFYAINQNQNSWSLATTQSKLNVIDTIWQEFRKRIRDKDVIDDLGL